MNTYACSFCATGICICENYLGGLIVIVVILILILSLCVSLIGTKDSDAIVMYYDCMIPDTESSGGGSPESQPDSDYTPISVDVGNVTRPVPFNENISYPQDNRPAAVETTKKSSSLNSADDIESALKAEDPVEIAESTYHLFFSNGGKSKK